MRTQEIINHHKKAILEAIENFAAVSVMQIDKESRPIRYQNITSKLMEISGMMSESQDSLYLSPEFKKIFDLIAVVNNDRATILNSEPFQVIIKNKSPGRTKLDFNITYSVLRAIYICEDEGIELEWLKELLTDESLRYISTKLNVWYNYEGKIHIAQPSLNDAKWKHHLKDSLERSILGNKRGTQEYKEEREKLKQSLLMDR